MVTERPRKKEKRYLNRTPSKSRSHEPILLLSDDRCSTLFNYNRYSYIWTFFDFIEWLKVFFFRFVFIFNFLNVKCFSFLDMLGLVIHHFWWKDCFPRTPGSYRYTNSMELVPRFGFWPSPRFTGYQTPGSYTCAILFELTLTLTAETSNVNFDKFALFKLTVVTVTIPQYRMELLAVWRYDKPKTKKGLIK